MTYEQQLFAELEALRVELGVTIEEAAALVGVTALTYQGWRTKPETDGAPAADKQHGLIYAKNVLNIGRLNHKLPVNVLGSPHALKILRRRILQQIRDSM